MNKCDANKITAIFENKLKEHYEHDAKSKIAECNILNESELNLFNNWFDTISYEERYNFYNICIKYSFNTICYILHETFKIVNEKK